MVAFYALHDSDIRLKEKGAIKITKDELDEYNEKGYGVYWVFNEFEGARKKENLIKINQWFCDIDGGDKKSQMDRINALMIPPSFIIETKNGYHCYWSVKGNASLENFEKIQQALVERLGGDRHCTDVLRMLRIPCYKHQKNPKEPFVVTLLDNIGSDKDYTESQMLAYFVKEPVKTKEMTSFKKFYKNGKNDFLDESKWERIFKLSNIYPGNRNGTFAKYIFWLKDEGLSNAEINHIINGLNQQITNPLPQREINTLLYSKGIR